MIGPVEDKFEDLLSVDPEPSEIEPLVLNGDIDWETPSARMNCSLNSMFVRPLAICETEE